MLSPAIVRHPSLSPIISLFDWLYAPKIQHMVRMSCLVHNLVDMAWLCGPFIELLYSHCHCCHYDPFFIGFVVLLSSIYGMCYFQSLLFWYPPLIHVLQRVIPAQRGRQTMDHHHRGLRRRNSDHVDSFINLGLLSFVATHHRPCSTQRLLFGAQWGSFLSSEWRTCKHDDNGSSCETHRLSTHTTFLFVMDNRSRHHNKTLMTTTLWYDLRCYDWYSTLGKEQGWHLTPWICLGPWVKSIGLGSRQHPSKWWHLQRLCCYKVKPMHIVWWISYSYCISFDVDPCIYKDLVKNTQWINRFVYSTWCSFSDIPRDHNTTQQEWWWNIQRRL